MIEINTPGIDIEKLKTLIEEEVERYKDVAPFPMDTSWEAPLLCEDPIDNRLSDFGNGTALPDHYSWFLQFHGREFIARAYYIILHRFPDAGGEDTYLKKLENSELTKVDVLGRLRYSREGRQKKVPLPGLLIPFLCQTFFKIPLLGWGLRVMAGVLNLPVVLKNIQKLETRTIEQQRVLGEALEAHDQTLNILEQNAIQDRESMTQMSRQMAHLNTEALMVPEADHSLFLKLPDQMQDQKVALLDMARRVGRLLEKSPEVISPPATQALMEKEATHVHDALYLAFENRFRGTSADIKERVAVYLPHIKKILERTGDVPVLDVGCGRGEWLTLLGENNIPATGLDLNLMMVAHCREAGLEVAGADVIAHLESLSAETLSAVTGFHIVEHLPFDTLIALFDEALRVLKPGGMIVFETPNPENIMVGACNFYTDPTHVNPIPPHTLSYLAEARGFVNIDILRLHPDTDIHINDPFLNHIFTVGRDYAVMGYKA